MSSFVFINPLEIEFTKETESPQTISIYNPYDFSITFSFRSTRPTAFALSSTYGEILPRHSLDILITLLDKTIIDEKFKIEIYSNSKKLGEKIVRVTYKTSDFINTTKRSNVSQKDYFHDLDQESFHGDPVQKLRRSDIHVDSKVLNQYLIYSALVICCTILMLPHEESTESHLNYFQVSVYFKLWAAYVLGIVTVILIRN